MSDVNTVALDQEPGKSIADPIELFHAAMALQEEDWQGAARLCDAVSLRSFKRRLAETYAPRLAYPPPTAELYMQHDPQMPREVAEYMVAQHSRGSDSVSRLETDVYGVHSVDELVALHPVQAFAAWLKARSPRRQIERLVALGRAPAPAPRTGERLDPSFYRYVALGSVMDGEHVCSVMFRGMFDEGADFGPHVEPHIATLPEDEATLFRKLMNRGWPQPPRCAICIRQDDQSWRLVANQGFMGVDSLHIAEVHAPRREA